MVLIVYPPVPTNFDPKLNFNLPQKMAQKLFCFLHLSRLQKWLVLKMYTKKYNPTYAPRRHVRHTLKGSLGSEKFMGRAADLGTLFQHVTACYQMCEMPRLCSLKMLAISI